MKLKTYLADCHEQRVQLISYCIGVVVRKLVEIDIYVTGPTRDWGKL